LEEKYKPSGVAHGVEALFGHIAKKQTKEALGVITRVVDQGIDIRMFIQQLLQALDQHCCK